MDDVVTVVVFGDLIDTAVKARRVETEGDLRRIEIEERFSLGDNVECRDHCENDGDRDEQSGANTRCVVSHWSVITGVCTAVENAAQSTLSESHEPMKMPQQKTQNDQAMRVKKASPGFGALSGSIRLRR